jgi:hypothetical protein
LVAHLLWEQEAGGSSPPSPTGEMQLTGGAKQLMERPDLGRWGRHKARRASPTRPAAWAKLSSLGRDELDRDRLCRPHRVRALRGRHRRGQTGRRPRDHELDGAGNAGGFQGVGCFRSVVTATMPSTTTSLVAERRKSCRGNGRLPARAEVRRNVYLEGRARGQRGPRRSLT